MAKLPVFAAALDVLFAALVVAFLAVLRDNLAAVPFFFSLRCVNQI
jgi:hypothetical protein